MSIDSILRGFLVIASLFFGVFIFFKILSKLSYGTSSTRPASQDPSVSTDSLKFVQLNPSWVPGSLASNRWRASVLPNELSTYDIVVLNGCPSFPGSPVASFVSAMRKLGFVFIARCPSVSLFSVALTDGGTVLLSKFPILKREFISFSLMIGWDQLADTGAVYARIQTGAGTHVHVVGVQCQSASGGVSLSRAVRFTQLRQIRSWLMRNAADGQPILVIGDFNVDGLAPEVTEKKTTSDYNRLLQSLAIDGYSLVDGLLDSFGEHLATRPGGQRLDYIMMMSREDGEYTITGQSSQVFSIGGGAEKGGAGNDAVSADVLFSLRTQNL
jgi:endonuclease/exonuclease/phosphatase family metal-dependent hydrolase